MRTPYKFSPTPPARASPVKRVERTRRANSQRRILLASPPSHTALDLEFPLIIPIATPANTGHTGPAAASPSHAAISTAKDTFSRHYPARYGNQANTDVEMTDAISDQLNKPDIALTKGKAVTKDKTPIKYKYESSVKAEHEIDDSDSYLLDATSTPTPLSSLSGDPEINSAGARHSVEMDVALTLALMQNSKAAGK